MDMKYLHLGGHDNVCFDAMLPLDVVPLRRQSLSDSTPVSGPPLYFKWLLNWKAWKGL